MSNDVPTTSAPEGARGRRRLIAVLATLALGAAALAGSQGAAADEGGHHGHSVCDESHPAVQEIIGEVRHSLEYEFTDAATLIARGFIPYFDAMIPGAYPPGGEGAGHYLNPDWIDDGNMLDPRHPEAVIVDEWGRAMGIMFIADEGSHGPPLYVAEDGTPCAPWHPHTDAPALFAWWFYETVYGGDTYNGEVEPDPVTPVMMHVWSMPNDKGWSSHGYPEAKYREGPPGIEDLPGPPAPTLPSAP